MAPWYDKAEGFIGVTGTQEAIDYAVGQACPQCPFWAHRERWTGDIVQ